MTSPVKPERTVWISDGQHARMIEPLPPGASWTDAIAGATVAVNPRG